VSSALAEGLARGYFIALSLIKNHMYVLYKIMVYQLKLSQQVLYPVVKEELLASNVACEVRSVFIYCFTLRTSPFIQV